MTDLTKLDAANKALQADKSAAKTTKAFAAEATSVLHALTAPVIPPAPAPSASAVAPPVGPFAEHTAELNYPTANPPQKITKIYVHDVTSSPHLVNGISMIEWPTLSEASSAWTVEDIIAERIGNTPFTSPPGTQDAAIAFGYQVNAARLILDGTWMGMELWGQCRDSTISDFVIGRADGKGGYTLPVPHVGVYFEHFARRNLLQRFDVHSLGTGFNFEWWYPDGYSKWVAQEYPLAAAGKSGPCCNTINTGRIYCPPQDAQGTTAGIFIGPGSWGNRVAVAGEPITFWGPGDAICKPAHLAGPTDNAINEANCVFLNAGRRVYTLDLPIG